MYGSEWGSSPPEGTRLVPQRERKTHDRWTEVEGRNCSWICRDGGWPSACCGGAWAPGVRQWINLRPERMAVRRPGLIQHSPCVRSLSRRMGTKGITVPSGSRWFGSRRVTPIDPGPVTVNHRPLSLPVSGDIGMRAPSWGIVRTTRHLGVSCLAVGLWESDRHSTFQHEGAVMREVMTYTRRVRATINQYSGRWNLSQWHIDEDGVIGWHGIPWPEDAS